MKPTRVRMLLVVLTLVVGPALSGVLWAAEVSDAERVLSSLVDAERTRLGETLDDFDRLSLRRSQTDELLEGLYLELDDAIKQTDTHSAESVNRVRGQIEALEDVRRGALLSLRGMLDRIEESRRRLQLLQEQEKALASTAKPGRGRLSGEWSVSLLPQGQSGIFTLQQNGTLVSGSYALDGGFDGLGKLLDVSQIHHQSATRFVGFFVQLSR